MQTVLIVVHLFIVLALIVTVLLQRSEGGLGLGGGSSGGGVSGFMTGRGQANALTRATAILAALFFTTSIALAIMAHHGSAPRSILDDGTAQPAAPKQGQPQNADNLLDTLRQQGGKPADGAPAPQAPAPAAPSAPAESAPVTPAPATPEAPQSR